MNYVEWDGTERCLGSLLVWWGTQIPWKHSDGCQGDSLHCCQGEHEFQSNASIEGGTCLFHTPACVIEIKFSDGSTPAEWLNPGDRIYYRGRGRFELVKK